MSYKNYKKSIKTEMPTNFSDDRAGQFSLFFGIMIWLIIVYYNYNNYFWYILIGILLLLWSWIYIYKSYQHKKLLSHNTINKISSMNPFEFEKLCSQILTNKWFTNTKITKSTADGGIDIFCSKNNTKYIVQCKRYNWSKLVSVMQIRELFWVARSLWIDVVPMVISTGYYSQDAQKFAKENNIIIVNRDQFVSDYMPYISIKS